MQEQIKIRVKMSNPNDVEVKSDSLNSQDCTVATAEIARSLGGTNVRNIGDEDPSEAHHHSIV